MEDAIKKAISRGYVHIQTNEDGLVVVPGSWKYIYDKLVLLDPLFWQALGKQQGWLQREYTIDDYVCSCGSPAFPDGVISVKQKHLSSCSAIQGYINNKKYEWQIQMRRFIDHLAEGKEIDLFFKTLLK